MKIILFVRTNIRWKGFDQKAYDSQFRSASDSLFSGAQERQDQISRHIENWDRVFQISYFEYRAQMQAIAERNWLAIAGVDAVVRSFSLLPYHECSEPFAILPVDDDDWFRHDVVDVLKSRELLDRWAVTWGYSFYVPHAPREKRRVRHEGQIFGSNAYAITQKGLIEMPEGKRRPVLRKHWFARGFFSKRDPELCRRVGLCLSMKNQSPASVSNLEKLKGCDDLKRQGDQMGTSPLDIPQDLEWARIYLEEAHALNIKLL